MNAPMNPNSSNKTQIPMATDISKRMGFNNFLRDVQGAAPTQPYVAPQMPTSMPQMAPNNPFMPQQQPMMPMMPPSSQSLRGGIGMPMQPVQGFDNGGVAEDPIFAAVRANNEKARAEQEALAAYMASRATAGPTPLEIARAGYLADQVDEPVQAPMQTMDIGEPTFSGGSPVAEVPVADTGGISSVAPDPVALPTAPVINTFTPTQPTFSTGSPLPAEPSMVTDQFGMPLVNKDFETGEIVSPVKGLDPVQPPASTLTPMQQLAQALQDKIEDVGFDTYKKRDGEYNVRFDDGTSKYDKDLLDQYGVSKEDFLGALRGYGNYIGPVGTRQSAGAGFEQGLENILNPEEAQESYDNALSAKKADDRRDARQEAQFKRAQDASSLKTGDGFLADLQASKNDPLGGLDDIGRAILDGSLFTPKDDQTAYKSVYDSVFGGGDDTPSAPPTQFSDANLNAMSDALGMEAFDALSGDQSALPLGPEDFAPYPLGGGADNNPNQNFGSDINQYGDVGTIPDELQFPDMDSALSGITQSDLAPYIYDAPGEFSGTGIRSEYMDDDEGSDSAVYVPPSVATNLGISLGDSGIGGDRTGVLPSSDLGRLVGGDQQIANDLMKLLAVDPDRTNEDLLSTATTRLGPYGPSVSGSGDSPVIGGVPQLGTLQNFDFTNQLQDRDMGGLGDEGLSGSFGGGSLTEGQDTINPLDLSGFERRFLDNDLSGSSLNEGQNTTNPPSPYMTLGEKILDMGRSSGKSQEQLMMEEAAKQYADSEGFTGLGDAAKSAGSSVFDNIFGTGRLGTNIKDASKQIAKGATEAIGYKSSGDLVDQAIDAMNLNDVRGSTLESGLQGISPSQFGREGDIDAAIQNALGATTGRLGDSNNPDFVPSTAAQDFMEPFSQGAIDLSKRIGDSVSEENKAIIANNIAQGDIKFNEYGVPIGIENFSLGKDPSIWGTVLQALEGVGDLITDAPLFLLGPGGVTAALGLNVNEAAGASADSIERRIAEMAEPTRDNMYGSMTGRSELEKLDFYQNALAATGDPEIAKQQTIAKAKEGLLRTGLMEGGLETVATAMAVNPAAMMKGLLGGSGEKIATAAFSATGSIIGEASSELVGELSENKSMQGVDPSVLVGDDALAAAIAGAKEGIGTSVAGLGIQAARPSGSGVQTGVDPSSATGQLLSGEAQTELQDQINELSTGQDITSTGPAETELQNEIDGLSKSEEIGLANEVLLDAGLDPELIDPVLREAGVIQNPPDQISSSTRTSQSEINTGTDINNELDNLANDETNTQSDGDNEAQVLSDANSSTDITNIVNTDTDTNIDTTPVVVSDPVVTTTPVIPPAEEEVVVEEDPVVEEEIQQAIANLSGDPDTAKSKQERRDYSRLREIIEQRARAPRGTAPGLGYKPVEGISNTLGKDSNNFDTLLGITRSQGFNEGGPVPSTLDKAADDFLNALRFG